MQKTDYQAYRALKDVGWDVDKRPSVRPHSGHETRRHLHAKTDAVWLAVEQGMRVSTEVPIHHSYTADILVHGKDGVEPFIVELDTQCDSEVIRQNAKKYTHGPIAEVFTIDLEELPEPDETVVNTLQEETWL